MVDIAFADAVPLAFRVLLFVQLGGHLWLAVLWYCYSVRKMNVLALLNLSYSPHKYYDDDRSADSASGEGATVSYADLNENQVLINGVSASTSRTLWFNIGGLIQYWVVELTVRDKTKRVHSFVSTVVPLLLLVFTLDTFFQRGQTMGQTRIHTTLRRVLGGGINSSMRTNDIILSDSLVSYSRVANDLVSLLWTSVLKTTYSTELEAFVLSYPAAIRIRQSWYEYTVTRQRHHLLNLIKYSLGVLPVFVNYLVKAQMASLAEGDSTMSLATLNWWWYAVAAISSTYLFVWDVNMDWGFGMFRPILGQRGAYVPLREPSLLFYKNGVMYYGIVLADFFLRFLWIWKIYVVHETELALTLKHRVGNFLFGYDSLLMGFAMGELLELVRRWLWCFLKLENDLVKLGVSLLTLPLSAKMG